MIRFFKHAVVAFQAYAASFQVLAQGFLWVSFVVPLLLSLGLYFGGEVLIDNLHNYDLDTMNVEDGSSYLMLGIKSILVYVFIFMNKYVVLILLAPLLFFLSTQTEYILTQNTYPFVFKHYVDDIKRALTISLRNMGLQMLVMGAFFAISLIYKLPPIVNQVVYFIVAFYFYGFAFMDYANERRRLTIPETVKFTRRHAGAAFVLGGVYGGLFYIPYAGVVIAPILGVIAGTIVVHALVDLSQNPYAIKKGEEKADKQREEESPEEK